MDASGYAPLSRAPARAFDDARFDEAFDRAFTAAAHTVNRFVVDHLLRASRELRVDYESLVIWGVLAHLNVAHLLPPGAATVGALSARGRIPADARRLRPIRVSHLAQVTGLPRETIRRKLLRLQDAKRVTQHAFGWTVDAATVEPELRAFSRETAIRLRAAVCQLDEVLAAGLDEVDRARHRATSRIGETSA